jgi:hypothetical protein
MRCNRPRATDKAHRVDVGTEKCTIDVMLLERCKDQPSKTLDEFYAELAAHDSYPDREGGQAMLDLIARLRRLEHPNRAWGLTSHYHLCLLAQDDSASPWYVRALTLDRRNYAIEYLMPPSLAPWPNAYVRGDARSEDEAIQMIITAMDRSGGWSGAKAR